MGFFLFVSSLAVLLFGVVLLISSPSERALNTALLAWKSKGKLVEGPAGHGVFVVDLHGAKKGGKTLVIAHGFPTSSFEWQHVLSLLLPHFERVVLFDYVGFGLSDKPILESGAYSVPDHADTLGFVIGSLEQESDKIELLCHDMSDSVCSELISRGFQAHRVTFLNGGMRWRLANLRLSQQILLTPVFGRWFGKLPVETFFKKQIRTLFVNQSSISDSELTDWYTLMMYNYGLLNMHKLIEYIRDRHRFEPRWTRALQKTNVPLRLIWGASDEVAPIAIAKQLVELVPKISLKSIANAGHWPFVEQPEEFVRLFLE